jgi:hypothetical protein
MSRNLRAARKFLRAAATCLLQAANLDTLDDRTRALVLHQALALDAEANLVGCRLVDAHNHLAAVRRNRSKR